MRRRAESPGSFNVWPAFTDVLGGLVVVLVFLITVFVIGEVLIGRELSGKNTAIDQLAQIIDGLERLVGESDSENERLDALLSQLRLRLTSTEESVETLSMQLDEARDREARLDRTLAEAEAEQARLVRELTARLMALESATEARTEAEDKVEASAGEIALLKARIQDLGFKLERLNKALFGARAAVSDERAELAQAQTALTERESRLLAQASLIEEQQGRIDEMDQLIKRRLLDRVEELEQYSSDFFGRLRDVFANNPDIKVVGDRFVFQSEVLFSSGEADLTLGGQDDLNKFAQVYRQVEAQLPPDLPVIIEVQGHTDAVPISTARFGSNWELSFFRALGVVDYLIDQGIPPDRLAAVGMGEYQPIETGSDPAALKRNRRIELKITSR
jgi:chemotaxis protein MotB